MEENKKEKREVEKIDLKTAVVKISELLLQNPHALNIGLVKEENGHNYRWSDVSVKAKSIRSKIRDILTELWRNGAYNYQQIADNLRVDVLAVRALIDEWMRSQYPHL